MKIYIVLLLTIISFIGMFLTVGKKSNYLEKQIGSNHPTLKFIIFFICFMGLIIYTMYLKNIGL